MFTESEAKANPVRAALEGFGPHVIPDQRKCLLSSFHSAQPLNSPNMRFLSEEPDTTGTNQQAIVI